MQGLVEKIVEKETRMEQKKAIEQAMLKNKESEIKEAQKYKAEIKRLITQIKLN